MELTTGYVLAQLTPALLTTDLHQCIKLIIYLYRF